MRTLLAKALAVAKPRLMFVLTFSMRDAYGPMRIGRKITCKPHHFLGMIFHQGFDYTLMQTSLLKWTSNVSYKFT